MAGVIRTNCAAILQAVAAQLVKKKCVGNPSRVIYVARRRQPPHFGGDRDILLRVRGFTVDKPQDQFAGRVTTLVHRFITVTPRVRDNRDEAQRDKVWLTASDMSQLLLEEMVADALHEFWPATADGQSNLTIQPIKLVEGRDPEREEQEASWGATDLTFSLDYWLAFPSGLGSQ